MRLTPDWPDVSANSPRWFGNASSSTVRYASAMQAWADGYDGWLGRPSGVVIAGSARNGRMSQYAYFASKQAISASNTAALAYARMRAASSSLRWCRRMRSVASWLKYTAPYGAV